MKGLISKMVFLLIALTVLSACTTIGSHVLSNPRAYFPDIKFIDRPPQDLGFEPKNHCHAVKHACINYLSAKAYKPENFPKDSRVFYNIETAGNGIASNITFQAFPEQFNNRKGTAVLIHGFGGSKEAMLATSIYFRAAGMDVILLDLFGHGQSSESFAFAAKEHEQYADLIAELELNEPVPTIVVGHSMGALAATKLLVNSEQIDGAILMAPMLRFDQAAHAYISYKNPTLYKFFANNLDEIVAQTMSEKELSLGETDIIKQLKQSNKPILMINSDSDTVSPPQYFDEVNKTNITKEVFKGRNHPSLIAFDQKDIEVIEQWLDNIKNNNKLLN